MINKTKKLIEQFTIGGETFGLAKILLEQTSETCPCKLGARDFKDDAEENNYLDNDDQPLTQIRPELDYQWTGEGNELEDNPDCYDKYTWDGLSILRPGSSYNGKLVKDVVEELITNKDNQTIQDVPTTCRVYKLLNKIKLDAEGGSRSCQELYTGDGTKDALLEDWMEKLCEMSSNLWYPPDDAQDANLKSKEGLVIFQLPNGDLKDVLHRKFEDLVAIKLGLDPSNKTTNTYTDCVRYYNVPYSVADEWFDDGRKKGPVMGKYKAFAVNFKCLPEESIYRDENLKIIELNHPLITRLYGNNSSEVYTDIETTDIETTDIETTDIETNSKDTNTGKYDDIPWL